MTPENTKNRLKEVRLEEGLPKAELARLAGVSVNTIRNIEANDHHARLETKHKIVNGINRNPDKTRTYALEYVFPGSQ